MTKTVVGAPQGKRSIHNLSNPHFTTTDLFKIQPVFCREVFKGDNFNVKMAQVNRVDNLPVSSFVEIENKHTWFYVKFNQVWKAWDAFKGRTPYAFDKLNNIPSRTPYFSLWELFSWFCGASTNPDDVTDYTLTYTSKGGVNHIDTTVDLPSCAADFQWYKNHEVDFIYVGNIKGFGGIVTDTPGVAGFTLNSVGRLIYSILHSLGYRVPPFAIDESAFVTAGGSSSQLAAVKTHIGTDNAFQMSDPSTYQDALPLMCYLSIILNYYVPTKFRDYSFFNSLTYLPNPIYHLSSGILSDFSYDLNYKTFRGQVNKLVYQLFFGSDYFTDSLTSPYGDVLSGNSFVDPSLGSPSIFVRQTVNGSVPKTEQLSNTTTNTLTSYLLAVLSSVASKSQIRALTQNNLLSSMLQQFGIKPESADMIPYMIYDHRDSIGVSPIVAMAGDISVGDTGQAPIGYKAGEGHGSAIHDDSFEFDNFGMLICVNAIAPVYSLADGLNREMLHTLPEDFFDPAYVNLGYQGVGNIELTLLPDNRSLGSTPAFDLTKTFGFQNKYAEYGYPKYSMGGDFVINSVSQGMDAFHFNRKLDLTPPTRLLNDNIFALAKLPVLYSVDFGRFDSQFDRIFDVDDPNYDHIQQWTYFRITAHRDIAANGEFTVGDWNKKEVEGKSIMDNVNQ